MPGRSGRAAAAGDPSSCGGRGVVADPGAGPGGGVARRLRRARRSALAAGGTSFRGWAQRLAAQAREAGVSAELSFWRGMLERPSLPLVERRLDPARDRAGHGRASELTLPAAVTRALLTRVPAAFHGGINEVLLTALAVAVADWRRRRQGGGGRASGRRCGAARSGGPRPRGGVRATSICRGRWAGSPACTRCGWIPGRSILPRRWRAGPRWAVR